MSIVKYKNQSGVTYAYEATSQYDPSTKQSRPKRKYLGRVDPETGEIVPTTGKRGRPRKNQATASSENNTNISPEHEELVRNLSKAEAQIAELRSENQKLVNENHRLKAFISEVVRKASDFLGRGSL